MVICAWYRQLENNIEIVTSTIMIKKYLIFPYAGGRMEFAEMCGPSRNNPNR